jgi:multidrug resistance efflux pump
LLGYDAAMLEGYQYFKQSVVNGRDVFADSKDSVFYRSLYTKYQSEYDELNALAVLAAEIYEALLNDITASETDMTNALAAVEATEKERDSFKDATLVTINNTILQIEATLAEKEVNIGTVALDYNISTAEKNMDSAEAAIDTYKNRILGEYNLTLSDYRNKLEDLRFSKQSAQSKEELLKNLETSYQQSKELQYFSAITQINNAIQSLEAELDSAESNLILNQIAGNLHKNNRDENGQPIAVSSAFIEQISAWLNARDSLDTKLDEIRYQIQQAQIQLDQGTIIAERAGLLNAITELVKGDILSAGAPVATIIPFNESEYKVQLYVSNAEIANIEIGDTIKYNIMALPSSQYGTVNGVVTNISKDALIQDGQYNGYFMVEGSVEKSELSDRNGNTASISIGMQTEAKVVTQEKKILLYLLEKIDLF